MRLALAIAFIALLALAGAIAFFYETFYGLVLPAVLIFSKRFVWRMVFRFFFVLTISWWPEWMRHKYFKMIKAFSVPFKRAGEITVAVWMRSPWPIRVLMSLAGAILSGVVALALLIFPIPIHRVPFVGLWLRETAMPYLLRTATAKGIELHLPPAWKKVPTGIRTFFEKPYKKLWRRTARYAVRTKQILSRQALIHERWKRILRSHNDPDAHH